eukprot:gene9567-10386_t
MKQKHKINKKNTQQKKSRPQRSSIYLTDFGSRVIEDPFTRLPDPVIQLILDYVKKNEALAVITSNCYLYRTWIRKTREILLDKKQSIIDYFTDESFRREVDARLIEPSKQLSIDCTEVITIDLSSFNKGVTSGGFSRVALSADFFLHLLEHLPERIEGIQTLQLTFYRAVTAAAYYQRGLFDYFTTSHVRRLSLTGFIFPFDEKSAGYAFRCPANVVELSLFDCFHGKMIASPSLKKLSLMRCGDLENIDDIAPQLEELNCRYGPNFIADLRSLRGVKRISLDANCQRKGNSYESLQENEEIRLGFKDVSNVDLRRCFRYCQVIELRAVKGVVRIDLSHYKRVRSFSLANDLYSRSTPLSLEGGRLYSNDFPATLKKLSLHNINNLTSLTHDTPFTHNLTDVEIVNCESFESCEGLANIPRLKLMSLKKLRSLHGLGGERVRELQLISLSDVEIIEEGIGSYRTVKVADCLKLRRLSVDVSQCLEVQGCADLDLIVLSGEKLERLKIHSCPKIQKIEGIDHVTSIHRYS